MEGQREGEEDSIREETMESSLVMDRRREWRRMRNIYRYSCEAFTMRMKNRRIERVREGKHFFLFDAMMGQGIKKRSLRWERSS